jgi:hypothetical protein
MTNLRHDGDDPEGLPFCSDACPACIADEAAAQKHIDELTECPVHGAYEATDYAGRPVCGPCDDDMLRREQLGERRAEEAAAMASQGFYWGGGEREDYFYHHPAF